MGQSSLCSGVLLLPLSYPGDGGGGGGLGTCNIRNGEMWCGVNLVPVFEYLCKFGTRFDLAKSKRK